MLPKAFISYTVRDGKYNLKSLKLIDRLLSPYFITFIDLLHNSSKKPQQRIIDELVKSNVVIVLFSEKTFSSPWVLFELSLAILLKKPIYYIIDEILLKDLNH